MFHLALHFIIPAITTLFIIQNKSYKNSWKTVYFILIATLLVDLDHLVANPIYDPSRCSIGFHPLHQIWFIAVYFLFLFIPKVRLIGIGLCIHMILDTIDCQITNGIWIN